QSGSKHILRCRLHVYCRSCVFGELAHAYLEPLPEHLGASAPDSWQQSREPFEGKFIARVVHQFQERGHILDMGLFEKSNAAGNVEGNVAARQLELQFQRVKMGTIKHGYIIQADTLIAQLERALGHESGLLTRVTANHERRLRSGLSVRDKLF